MNGAPVVRLIFFCVGGRDIFPLLTVAPTNTDKREDTDMNIIRSLRRGESSHGEDPRVMAAQAMDDTRELASQALERAGERLRELRYGVRDMANRGASSMGEYAQATTRYVTEQPLKSALIAAAIGAAVAGLVLALRRNRRYY
jgi:ElaB/YqjD/DUF883 family membrane-anchored ribosome-binding protein